MIAFISDIHSNTEALGVVLDEIERLGCDRILCLGDVIGYGPQPRETLLKIIDVCELSLLGNHEQGCMFYASDFNPKARQAIDWTKDEISAGDRERSYAYWDFLGELEPKADDGVAMFAHGSPRDPVREYLVPRDIQDEVKMRANFERMSAPICFVGHSHVPAVYYEDRRLYRPRDTEGPYEVGADTRVIINVGSVGQPRDGDNRLSYVLFDGRSVTFVRLAYDIERAADAIRAVAALPNYLADRLAVGR